MLICSKSGARLATPAELEPDLEDFASGQRVDFFIKQTLIGFAVGVGGKSLRTIVSETGVTDILVFDGETQPKKEGMVKVVVLGEDPDLVFEAKSKIEVVQDDVEINATERAWLENDAPVTLLAMRDQSGCHAVRFSSSGPGFAAKVRSTGALVD